MATLWSILRMLRKTPLKRSTKPMKRTRLKMRGTSDSSVLKDEIQALLRQIVIKRDKKCLLSHYPETGACGPRRNDGELIYQAEHLNGRSHMISFADSRNVVLLCQRHHIYWKPQNSRRYWEIIEEMIGPTRWDYFKKVEADRKAYKIDLKLAKVALLQELREIKQ